MSEQRPDVTMEQIKNMHPYPWRPQINYDGKGRVRLMDSKGLEVPLFAIIALSQLVTEHLARKAA